MTPHVVVGMVSHAHDTAAEAVECEHEHQAVLARLDTELWRHRAA